MRLIKKTILINDKHEKNSNYYVDVRHFEQSFLSSKPSRNILYHTKDRNKYRKCHQQQTLHRY